MGNLQPLEKNLFIRKNANKQSLKLYFINLSLLLGNLTTSKVYKPKEIC